MMATRTARRSGIFDSSQGSAVGRLPGDRVAEAHRAASERFDRPYELERGLAPACSTIDAERQP